MQTRIPFAKVPQDLMGAMMAVENYVNRNGFDIKLLELMRLRVAQINGCAYCIDMHFKEGLHHDEKLERLYSLPAWRDAPFYTPKERAVLAWAEAVTLPAAEGDLDALYQALLDHFNQEQVANLTIAVVQINSWTRLAKTFGFEAGHYRAGAP